MITIQIKELKNFLTNAKNIRDNKILPILSYVKLECKGISATMTKTNLNSFLIQQVEADFKKDETILIEEQALSAAVNFSKGKELKISISGKNIVMNDGFGDTKCQFQEIINFPSIENNTGVEKVELNTDVISSLSVAKNHCLQATDKAVRNWMCFVHLRKVNGKFYVIGVNGAICYFKMFKEKMSEISLDPETVSVISKYPIVEYSSSERYDYFQCLNVTYGFIKAETACPNFEPILAKFNSENSFIVNRKDILFFCEKAESMSISAVPPEVSIENDKNGLLLNYISISQDSAANEVIKTDSKTYDVERILFAPKNMVTVLKDLQADKIKIEKIFGNMVISSVEEPNYIGSVMELAKL